MLNSGFASPTCPECRAVRAKDEWYCPECGSPLPVISKQPAVGILLASLGTLFLLAAGMAIIVRAAEGVSTPGLIIVISLILAGVSFGGRSRVLRKAAKEADEERNQAIKAFNSSKRYSAAENTCPNCGTRIREYDKFCNRCAATLSPKVMTAPSIPLRLGAWAIVVILILPEFVIYYDLMWGLSLLVVAITIIVALKLFSRRSQKEGKEVGLKD
jgi:hypothetical protein